MHVHDLLHDGEPEADAAFAAAEEGVPFRAIAEAIGKGLGVPARSIPAAEAPAVMGGFIGMIAQLDNPTSSAKTRQVLGWKPEHADLLADIAAGHYFKS